MAALEILTIIMIIIINLTMAITLHVYTVASIQKEMREILKLIKEKIVKNDHTRH